MDLIWILVVFVVIIASMVVHEVAHGLVSYWLGDDTAKQHGRLTLNPFKHMDPIMTVLLPLLLFIAGGPIFGGAKPVPLDNRKLRGREFGVALVALAGPLSNFLIAFVAFGFFSIFAQTASILAQVLVITVQVNLGFMIFNLIPIPPLDGSRIIYSIAPDFVRRIMDRIEVFGFMIIMMMLILLSPVLGSFIMAVQSIIIELFMAIFRG